MIYETNRGGSSIRYRVFCVFLLLFSKKIISSMKKNPSQKVVIVEKELDDYIDYIGSLEDLPRLVFIDEECRDPKIFD